LTLLALQQSKKEEDLKRNYDELRLQSDSNNIHKDKRIAEMGVVIATLEEKVKGHILKMSSCTKQIQELEFLIQKLHIENNNLSGQLQEKNNKSHKIGLQLEAKNKENSQLKESNNILSSEKSQLFSKLEKEQKELKTLNIQYSKLQQYCYNLEQQTSQLLNLQGQRDQRIKELEQELEMANIIYQKIPYKDDSSSRSDHGDALSISDGGFDQGSEGVNGNLENSFYPSRRSSCLQKENLAISVAGGFPKVAMIDQQIQVSQDWTIVEKYDNYDNVNQSGGEVALPYRYEVNNSNIRKQKADRQEQKENKDKPRARRLEDSQIDNGLSEVERVEKWSSLGANPQTRKLTRNLRSQLLQEFMLNPIESVKNRTQNCSIF
jgi:hypothetical protein